MSNNPKKMEAVETAGVQVAARRFERRIAGAPNAQDQETCCMSAMPTLERYQAGDSLRSGIRRKPTRYWCTVLLVHSDEHSRLRR